MKAAAFLFVACAALPAAAQDPAASVTGFYARYVALKVDGLPSPAQQRELAPFLSRRLQKLLDDARAYQRKQAKAHPDEKPPWADGCLFASLFEGPMTAEVERTEPKAADQWHVVVNFAHDEARWQDTVVVTREAGRAVIDDVLLGGAGAFNPPGRLSESLRNR